MWKEYNPNPAGRKVEDCSVRAISKALNTDWETAFCLLSEAAYQMADMPSANGPYGNNSYGNSYNGPYAMYNDGMNMRGTSYARGGGRYSRSNDMIYELNELMEDAPDDRTRMEFQRFIQKIQNMQGR